VDFKASTQLWPIDLRLIDHNAESAPANDVRIPDEPKIELIIGYIG